MRIMMRWLVLLSCFIFFDKVMAQEFKSKTPSYLESSSRQKSRSSLTQFEREVSEVDPFIKDHIPEDTKLKSENFKDNLQNFHPLNDQDMEDIFSSATEYTIRNEELKKGNPSLIDKISSQNEEIKIVKTKKRLIVGNQKESEEQTPSIINEVFGPDPSEEPEGDDGSTIPGEKFAYEEEKEIGGDMPMEEHINQQIDNNNDNIERRPTSSYGQENSPGNFKSGMHTFFKNCVLYSEPETSAEPQVIVKSGKELWLDKFNNKWHKAYTKDGPVFLQTDCVN